MNKSSSAVDHVSCKPWLALFACLVAACSSDPSKNPLHGAKCSKDLEYKGFCLSVTDGGSSLHGGSDGGGTIVDAGKTGDAAQADASNVDAGTDAGKQDAAVDAGMNMSDPCSKKQEGTSDVCYDGPIATISQAPCHVGYKLCKDGQWGPCKDEQTPVTETCNSIDDDCDGTIDEAIPSTACGVLNTLVGTPCSAGKTQCDHGAISCKQLVFPTTETCDGKDNNCDGTTDEGTDQPCFDGSTGCDADGTNCKGICKGGVYPCTSGTIVMTGGCVGEVTAEPMELCAAANVVPTDENCNGQTDEVCMCTSSTFYTCYSGTPGTEGVGPCLAGSRQCVAGALPPACPGEVTDVVETCNGIDDDCNGVTDDIPNLGMTCPTPGANTVAGTFGPCASGVWMCMSNAEACIGPTAATSDTTCNNYDDDCNGVKDDGVKFDTDVNNCGKCGNKCATGLSCCEGACVDVKSSITDCGKCGTHCAEGCCSGTCRNTDNDVNHCGPSCQVCKGLLGLLASCSNGHC